MAFPTNSWPSCWVATSDGSDRKFPGWYGPRYLEVMGPAAVGALKFVGTGGVEEGGRMGGDWKNGLVPGLV